MKYRTSNNKHPLEEPKSWELHLERQADIDASRRLKKKQQHGRHEKDHHPLQNVSMEGDAYENDFPTTTTTAQVHVGVHKVYPEPEKGTMHAFMIDGGSQGSRIHLYEFERRMLHTREQVTKALNGFQLTLPTTNSRWTNRLHPGLDKLASISDDDDLQLALIDYLGPLVEFCKSVLKEKKVDWHRYPIYLKATGGLRTLATPDRIRLVSAVRTLFQNKTFNPFNFDDVERVRVISGEEEAIYGWAAVNLAKGTLVQDSEGTGTVLNPQKTVGMLEMGGASTQIAFFENRGDVMANLIKLQIGGARHWNVYAHSFLYFGVKGAWARLNAMLYLNGDDAGTTINPCLPAKSSTDFESWIHIDEGIRFLPRSDNRSTYYNISMHNEDPNVGECARITRALLRKDTNKEWVEFSHDGDCSFAGVYQPPLPRKNSLIDEFIVTSNYYEVWEFLQLPDRSKVRAVGAAAQKVCALDIDELEEYNSKLDRPVHDYDLSQFCFRSMFAYEMLYTGYGFPLDYEIEAADVVDGQKVGWALGSILYEINTLPWEFGGKLQIKSDAEGDSNLTAKDTHSNKHHDHRHHHRHGHGHGHDKQTMMGMARSSGSLGPIDFGAWVVGALVVGTVVASLAWKNRRHHLHRDGYEQVPSSA